MIITQTPLRISFLGGNTDFPEFFLNYGGRVLATTIDKYVYCIVKERFDDKIIINYSKKEIVDKVDDLEHELVRESLRLLGIEKGLEISFLSDIPSTGSGLGSSSAVTVGTLNALHTYLGDNVNARYLAEEAVEIETKILKKHIGIQDQHEVSMGGLRLIDFSPGGDISGKKIVMDESVKEDFNNSLMMFYTDTKRRTDDILSSFKISENIPMLKQNLEFARVGTESLLKGNLNKFGKTLDEYWQIKKTLSSKISNLQIDEMYSLAKKAGAIGGKILGAGGGGFLLVMFPANKRMKVRQSLKDYRELPFRMIDFGSRIMLNI